MSTSSIERIICDEYEKVIRKAEEKYGKFEIPFFYIPELDEGFWKELFFPDGGKRKVHGMINRVETGEVVIALNTWTLIRHFDEFGETSTRWMVSDILSHEIIHQIHPEWLDEMDVNVEGLKLHMLVHPPHLD